MEFTEEEALRLRMKHWCKTHACISGHGPATKRCPVYNVCIAVWDEASFEQLIAGADAIDKALKIRKYKET